MEYGVWNRDYDLYINGVDHLVAKRKLIQPRRHERERNTKKKTEKQPSRRRALQVNIPPIRRPCTLPRNGNKKREKKNKPCTLLQMQKRGFKN